MKGLREQPTWEELDSISVVSVIEQTGVSLTRSGSVYSGLCPLHGDKETPSLRVYPDTNSWSCFGAGCGNKTSGKLNGGGAANWIMQKMNLEYQDAVRWLLGESSTFSRAEIVEIPKLSKAQKFVPDEMVLYWHSLLDKCSRREYYHSRGFDDKFIDREMWGWDGKRYVLPVWSGKPGQSSCEGVRLRVAPDIGKKSEVKYRGLKDHNRPTVWGRWHCQQDKLILGFAGEFDAARAVSDGLPAFSLVNGVNAFQRFPSDWPNLWFPNSEFLVVVFDKKEESMAGRLATSWMKVKGYESAKVLIWPPHTQAKDYCEFRDGKNTPDDFKAMMLAQLQGRYIL